ncbi:sensor histidine kinase GraS [Peptococcaceae bacterium CEB3]|nr:sensor histidine kinase GraS [Peptococcaceae bacterium CEB3]
MSRQPKETTQERMEAMSYFAKLAFCRDQGLYVIHFYGALFLAGTVVTLALRESKIAIGWNNVIYILLLSSALLGLFFVLRYTWEREYRRQMAQALAGEDGLESALKVQAGVRREQLGVQLLLQRLYRTYEEELAQAQRSQDLHRVFIDRWVHQMKTPLSVIDLSVQRGENFPPGEARALLTSIGEENDKLWHGLDMVLHWARLREFHLDVRIDRVSLQELVRRVVNEHKKEWIHASVYPQIEGDDAVVETDEKWLVFILHQLINNALKYSRLKEGNKHLVFRMEREGNTVRLVVRDEGVGIAAEDLPRIFDPFFTGENGRRVRESTGMGLYLVKEVCAHLGHEVAVSSTVGEGTAVTLTFSRGTLDGMSGR